ncbi:MAG: glycosyltransferase [Prevotella sp.]|nr:glycosyltransferase [Prevotella sp.]
MKILHIITSLQTGGAETLVVNLMPRFRDLGHEVGLVVFNNEKTKLMERLKHECPECKIYELGTSCYNPLYIIKLIGIMKKYDIVHTHNSSPQLFAAIANLFTRKKLITTEHNTSNRRRYWKWYANIDRWMYNRYNRIICISNQAEENLRNYLKRDKLPIVTIFNGVDIASFHNAKPIEELKTDKFVAIMVAGFRKQKDQDTLVKAIAKLPKEKFELWLVGTGERLNDVKNLAKNLNIEDNVKFLGLRTDVARLLHTADVVVMSSHYEGLSLSNIEGMSVDKPFIASDVDGLHEITEGYGILFPHEDSDSLAKIIERLSTDQDYYNQVASSCYARAQQFDITKMVEGYEGVYTQR